MSTPSSLDRLTSLALQLASVRKQLVEVLANDESVVGALRDDLSEIRDSIDQTMPGMAFVVVRDLRQAGRREPKELTAIVDKLAQEMGYSRAGSR